jgi:serine/threonine-protein kinase
VYPQVFGKYVLERELSRGGMARVVLATLRGAGGFEKKLVVKQIRDELAFDQQFIRRFVEEAKTTVALSHPNIVPVYELGVEQGTYFLAMELVEGLSVADLLRERNADGTRRVLTPEEGAYVGVEVCRALDYAHRRMKVVHRDITPRNVMIDEEGQIKLIDFGIAAPALVAGQEILGSPGHMAPEQAEGTELGPSTDIFAVAVLLLEAWTGSAPFRRATPEECAASMRAPHPRPSDFDPRLAPLDLPIAKAMSIDARERQQQASELGRALRAFLQNVDVGDIARALGDRVRDQRFEVFSSGPVSHLAGSSRPPTQSQLEHSTQTFAARDETQWSSQPPPPAGWSEPIDIAPSTRQLPQSVPKVAVVDPAMAIPTPLVVDVDELDKIRADLVAKRSERPPPAQGAASSQVSPPAQGSLPPAEVETIATRPLETPVRSPEVAPSASPPRSARGGRGLILGGAAAAVAIALGAFLWHGRPTAPIPAAPVATPASASLPTTSEPPVIATSTASPTAPAQAETSARSVGAPAQAATPSTMISPVVSAARPVAPPSAASNEATAVTAAGKATVVFLGEPGTRVAVDGVARGKCPVRLPLGEGSHEVRFTFDPTGETRGERIMIKSGERVTVRAEFTGATPTVKVHR